MKKVQFILMLVLGMSMLVTSCKKEDDVKPDPSLFEKYTSTKAGTKCDSLTQIKTIQQVISIGTIRYDTVFMQDKITGQYITDPKTGKKIPYQKMVNNVLVDSTTTVVVNKEVAATTALNDFKNLYYDMFAGFEATISKYSDKKVVFNSELSKLKILNRIPTGDTKEIITQITDEINNNLYVWMNENPTRSKSEIIGLIADRFYPKSEILFKAYFDEVMKDKWGGQ